MLLVLVSILSLIALFGFLALEVSDELASDKRQRQGKPAAEANEKDKKKC